MQDYILASQAGIVGDGKTDDTPKWQALIDSAPDGSCIIVPNNMQSLITAPLTVFSRSGLHFLNLGRPDSRARGQRGAEFLWGGPAGLDSMWAVNSSRLCTWTGISLSFDGPNAPACGIRFDTWADPQGRKPTVNGTRCTLSDCLIVPPKTAGNFIGVDISRESKNNQEFMRLSDCLIVPSGANGWGTGVKVGASSNSKSHLIERLAVTGASAGIWFAGGSGLIYRATGANNAVDIRHDNVVDQLLIEGCNLEGTTQCGLSLGGNSAPVVVRNSRWAGFTCQTLFSLYCQQVILQGNRLYAPASLKAQAFSTSPAPSSTRVYVEGNLWSNVQVNGDAFLTFEKGPADWARTY